MPSAKSTLLVVTSQSLFRECLRSAIRTQLPDVSVETVGTVKQTYERCALTNYLLVVFDIDGLPAFSPSETRKFTKQFNGSTVLIVGRCRHENDAIEYLEAGAADFRVADSESLEEFCEVIACALRGEVIHAPERTRAIFARLRQLSAEMSRISLMDTSVLTDRETEILQLLDHGQSNKQIAKVLHISLHTVKNHVHRILEKLEVTNRREAVHLAYSNGWLKLT